MMPTLGYIIYRREVGSDLYKPPIKELTLYGRRPFRDGLLLLLPNLDFLLSVTVRDYSSVSMSDL